MISQRLRPAALALVAVLLSAAAALAQPPDFGDNGGGAAGAGGVACAVVAGCFWFVFIIGFALIPIISMWMIFTKAGKPGWAAIVPIYNLYVLMEIAEKPMLWFILALVPCVNIFIMIMTTLELAKKFGKDQMFGIGMILLPFVFYPMLAFGKAQYLGTGQMPPS